MSDTKNFKVVVEGSALGVLHLMATKGIVKLDTDRSLGDYQGRVHLSADPNDASVTLYVNPGEGNELSDHGPPRPTFEPPRPTFEPPRP